MLKNKIFWILTLVFLLGLESCKLMYPNRMFKKGNYEYFSVGQETIDNYTIQKGDLLTLRIFSRNGFDLIDVLPNETGGGTNSSGNFNGGTNNSNGGNNISNGLPPNIYLVEQDGYVELPLFGRTYVLGLTENQLEDYIEERCSAIFNDPYAVLRVTNRRVFIFKGSEAAVVSLNPGPTTLIEVIAKSGGIGEDLKAYDIKILRGNLKNPEVMEVDLSTMEGLKNAQLIVQTNDVIYISQRYRVVRNINREVAPILSLAATLTTLLVLIKK